MFTSGARFIFGFESAGVEGGHRKCLVMLRASEVAESDFEVLEQLSGALGSIIMGWSCGNRQSSIQSSIIQHHGHSLVVDKRRSDLHANECRRHREALISTRRVRCALLLVKTQN